MEKGFEGALVLFTIYDPSGQGNLAESSIQSVERLFLLQISKIF